MRVLKRFLRASCGAVTVDWLVISAAAVLLSLSLGLILKGQDESRAFQGFRQIIETAVDDIGTTQSQTETN